MVFKSLNGLAPEYLSSKFIARSKTTSYTPRDSVNKLTIPQPHTNYLRNSFRYSGAVLRNSLPETLRQAESLSKGRHSWKTGFFFAFFFFVYTWLNNFNIPFRKTQEMFLF